MLFEASAFHILSNPRMKVAQALTMQTTLTAAQSPATSLTVTEAAKTKNAQDIIRSHQLHF